MIESKEYFLDKTTGVWSRPGFAGINYSDGAHAEERLFKIISEASDRSSRSFELESHITDWISEYHLSQNRTNLLTGFNFAKNKRALEIGSGTGSITRYLGEQGLSVTSIEGSLARAKIAASRCREQENVSVLCEDFSNFNADSKYDYVFLIGVLEYAPTFFKQNGGAAGLLQKISELLSKDGQLILAIENQLGLKYLLGHTEDHHGRAGIGVENAYVEGMPRTWGRAELTHMLCEAGFTKFEFLFPFPDYKIPDVIIHERSLTRHDFEVQDLLINTRSRSYSGDPEISLAESMIWDTVVRNGSLPNLANSFLIVASNSNLSAELPLAQHFSKRNFQVVCSTFNESGDAISVKKEIISGLPGSGEDITQNLETGPYIYGSNYLQKLRSILADGGTNSYVVQWARKWLSHVLNSAQVSTSDYANALLPAGYLDAVPFNCVEDKDGKLHFIDLEWQIKGGVPIKWLLVRGLMYSVDRSPRKGFLEGTSYLDFLRSTCAALGSPLTDFDFEDVIRLERSFILSIDRTLNPRNSTYFEQKLGCKILSEVTAISISHQASIDEVSGLREELRQKDTMVNSILGSRSWKMTAPLRATFSRVKTG